MLFRSVRIDLTFLASDANNYFDVLDGLELSGAYVNEAAQVEWDKIQKLQERVGRFKPPGGAAMGKKFLSFGVIMDTNTPLETSWWHQMEFVEIPKRMLWFVQPPAAIEVKRGGEIVYAPNVDDAEALRKYGVTPEDLTLFPSVTYFPAYASLRGGGLLAQVRQPAQYRRAIPVCPTVLILFFMLTLFSYLHFVCLQQHSYLCHDVFDNTGKSIL